MDRVKVTHEMVQRIIDEIDFADGSHAHEEVERGLQAVLDMRQVKLAILDEAVEELQRLKESQQ
jgi:hypothetical protein